MTEAGAGVAPSQDTLRIPQKPEETPAWTVPQSLRKEPALSTP